MDRPLDAGFARRQKAKKMAAGAGVLVGLVVVVGAVPHFIRPTLDRSDIRTARVEAGLVEATISATGTVVPEFEHVLSSPIDARVLRVLRKAGATLEPGEPILDLDVSESRLAHDKVVERLALKRNEEKLKRLALARTLAELKGQAAVAAIDVKAFRVKLGQVQQLHDAGLSSADQLRQAQVDLEKAEVQLARGNDSIANAETASAAELESLAVEARMLAQEQAVSARQLDLATAKADRGGVLTWVVTEEGALVRKGDVLARIADLTTFRVQATLSDVHAQRVAVGMPARVRLSETSTLDGTVAGILPTIKDGVMTLNVALDERSSPLLRANLRVDVFVVTDRRASALRVRRGPFATAAGRQDVFVVRGPKAVRTGVRLGLASFEYVEVVEGLLPGDEVIVSDMREYAHLAEVRLR
ncbi:MAG TPA: HlyD family efflux transporter periplasmic adaptor subunit [Vicinamibacteria bacterium]|nr:HlyD family efflux transporter periplasmic adaptor subunit [Vicinamibacteria bacterium]